MVGYGPLLPNRTVRFHGVFGGLSGLVSEVAVGRLLTLLRNRIASNQTFR
jgi:hypothetical protein